MLWIEALRAGILPITSTSGVSSVASSTGPSTQSQSTSPPTAVPGSNEDSATNSGGLSPGGIVGIVIGVAVVAILLFIFWRMLLASRSRKAAHRAPQYDSVNPFSDKQDPLSPPGHIHSNLPNLASNVTPYMYVSRSMLFYNHRQGLTCVISESFRCQPHTGFA
jgi:hypothetical protein